MERNTLIMKVFVVGIFCLFTVNFVTGQNMNIADGMTENTIITENEGFVVTDFGEGDFDCKIEFTYVPPIGSDFDLEGRVVCEDPNDCNNYAVAVYIYVPDGWWTKPYWDEPLTAIQSDCTWTCDITTGGQDNCATKIVAFLLPNGYVPIRGNGQPCLPSKLYEYPHIQINRYRTLIFSGYTGYTWGVKRCCGNKIGPGPNYYTDDPNDVWVDPNGHLHLRIVYRNGKWYCSEVISKDSFGYGTYIITIEGDLSLLDERIVAGFFTWEDCVPEHSYREIDFESSRWSDPNEPNNAQFIIQPDIAGHKKRFNIDTAEDNTFTIVFTWNRDKVSFRGYYGDFSLVPPTDSMIECWDFTNSSDIPPEGTENARINLWLDGGSPPQNGQEAEIIIKSFQYLPDVRPEIEFVDFATFSEHWLEADCGPCGGADLDNNNAVDFNDLRVLTAYWLEQPR